MGAVRWRSFGGMGGLVWQQIRNAGWGKGEEISQMTDVWGKMISDVWLTFCSPINRDKWAQTSEHSQSFSPSWAASWNDLIISLIVAIKKTSRSCQYFGDSFGMNDPKIKKHSSAHMIVNLCVKIKKSFTPSNNGSFAMCVIRGGDFSHARHRHTYCQSHRQTLPRQLFFVVKDL